MSDLYSSYLFDLIKSLSASEKRYFKLVNKLDEQAKYYLLFEVIDKQTQFDEVLIIRENTWIKPQQYSNLKAHLYQKLLESLRRYKAANSVEIQLREMIDFVQILFHRNLYTQCLKVLQKAKRKAEQLGNLEIQLEIMKWEKQLMPYTNNQNHEGYTKTMVKEVRQLTERINTVNTLSNLTVHLNSFYLKHGFIRDEADFEKVSQVFHKNLPPLDIDKLSFHEESTLYELLTTYYSYIQDFEQNHQYANKWVQLFDKNPEQIRQQVEIYIKAVNTLLIAQYKTDRYQQFVETKRRLKAILRIKKLDINENIRLKLLKYTYVHEFNRIFMVGEFDKGVQLLEKIKPNFEDFIKQFDRHSRLIMYYKIACLYMGHGGYKETSFWLNKIINMQEGNLREDVQCFARILNLIVHYELGNQDLVDYYLRSTYRFLLKKDDLHLYQQYMLNFLKQLDRQMTQKDLEIRFKELLIKLKPLKQSRYDKRAFFYFDIISWLESKIEYRSVQEIIKRKVDEKFSISTGL